MKMVCIEDLFEIIIIFFCSVPSKPTEVFFPDVDHWSAKMTWQQPTKLNGILIGYKLIYWRSDDEQTRIEIDNLTDTTNSYLAESMSKNFHPRIDGFLLITFSFIQIWKKQHRIRLFYALKLALVVVKPALIVY
jgi:hypothetical protein